MGYDIVPTPEEADIAILNTCSVTEKAGRDGRSLLRRFRRINPKGLMVATGCYAQTHGQTLVDMPEVDYVVPNSEKNDLAQLVHEKYQTNSKDKSPQGVPIVHENKQQHFKKALNLIPPYADRTRAFLKIQDGCNGFCSYCLIPYARGQSRSVAPSQVVQEVKRQIDQGTHEIVFTGIHIGDYGRDLSSKAEPFLDLLEEIFALKGLGRIRISSLEPSEASESLIQLLKAHEAHVCEHFHMPLQSGTDRILKLMRRTYTTYDYAESVAMIRRYFPNAYFGADIIPGFPSESDAEAEETLLFIRRLQLSELHVFPYSKRPNTAAIRMPHHLAQAVIKDRRQALQELSFELKTAYLRSQLGTKVKVLWEDRTTPSAQAIGTTSNYIEVVAPKGFSCSPGQTDVMTLKGFINDKQILVVKD